MANEPTITVTGNLTADPELRYTTSGVPVANFTIANTPRTRNAAGEWADAETWFVRCSAWRDLAENIAASLTRGAAVVATGRLTARTYDHTDRDTGQTTRRTVVELTADDVGPSLRRATAKVVKTIREHPTSNGAAAGHAEDPWATTGNSMAPPAATGAAATTGTGGYSTDPPF
jgi:single-strand DNA-binding protein